MREKEVKLAEMLINELTEKKFDPLQFKDEYRERLLDRIRAKSKGKAIEPEEQEEEKGGEVIDIMEALRRSLGKGGRRAAQRANRAAKTATAAHEKREASQRTRVRVEEAESVVANACPTCSRSTDRCATSATRRSRRAASRRRRSCRSSSSRSTHASRLHYDFRLEMEGVLKSWAVPKGPSYDPTVKRLAMMTEDHPYDYAAFEGVIPAGNYGGGNVIIWDNGTWEFIEPGDDPVEGAQAGKLTFRMYGKKMFGEWALVKINGRSGQQGQRVAAAQASRRVRERRGRRDRGRAAVGRLEQDGRRDRLVETDLAEQPRRGASGKNAPTLASKLEAEKEAAKRKTTKKRAPAAPPTRSARAPKKAASSPSRSSRAGSPRKARTHSTSSTSLSCGVSVPPT